MYWPGAQALEEQDSWTGQLEHEELKDLGAASESQTLVPRMLLRTKVVCRCERSTDNPAHNKSFEAVPGMDISGILT